MTMTVISCPGQCGFIVEDYLGKLRMAEHLMTCPKGMATMELMRRFGLWMLQAIGDAFDDRMLPADYRHTADWCDLSRTLVMNYLGMSS
jgi:hypothetical protein